MSDDVLSGLAAFAAIVVQTRLRPAITRRIPALERVRELIPTADECKRALPKDPPVVRASDRVGRLTRR